MSISRRAFVVGSTLTLAGCGGRELWKDESHIPVLTPMEDEVGETGDAVDSVLSQDDIEAIERKNYEKNHPDDIVMFERLVGFDYGSIKRFQEDNGLDNDGDAGPGTLLALYKQANYMGYNFTEVQQNRWDAYKEVGERYPDWKRYVREKGRVVTLRAKKRPNVFSKSYFFGSTEGLPLPGTYINSALVGSVANNISSSGVKGFLTRVGGRYVISIYVNGSLELASFTSPGNTARYGSGARTPELVKTNIRLDNDNPDNLTTKMHFISGGEDSVVGTQNADGSYNSDVMPYAVAIDNTRGIYTHAGVVTGDPLSHGCSRLPLYYARGAYKIFEQYGEITWDTHYS